MKEDEEAARPARGDERWLVAGCVALGLVPVLLFVPILSILPNLIEARGGGPEKYAIGALRTLSSAQTLFREGDREQDGTLDYGTLDELSAATLVDPFLGSGQKVGYRFEVRLSPTSPEFLWMAVANPHTPPGSLLREALQNPFAQPEVRRSFATNHSGVIFYTVDTELRCSDTCQIPSCCVQVGR